MPLSSHFDIAGPMAKSPRDAADLLTVLVDPSKTEVPEGGYASALVGDWKDIKVGTLDPEFWKRPSIVIKPVREATKQLVSPVCYISVRGSLLIIYPGRRNSCYIHQD